MSCGTPDPRLLTRTSTTGLLPSLVPLSNGLCLSSLRIARVHTPKIRRSSVWALSISLAATLKIDVSFSSCGYLDVSVPRVSSVKLLIHLTVTAHYCSRVAPFGYLRVTGYVLLTAAFRSLSRPSSALSAKASALCSFSLDLK